MFLLLALIFSVAFLYSTVGHGGASGYLAVMSILAFRPQEMSAVALILNILVSSAAFISYKKAGHFKYSLLLPFLILSIPMAWIGASLHIPKQSYSLLLAGTLLFAAFRLSFSIEPQVRTQDSGRLNFIAALGVGSLIGLVSGIVGIGGGIFLSSFLLLAGWCKTKESSAVAAPFIFINSIAGLIPRLSRQDLDWPMIWPYALTATAGGVLGSQLGANRFTSPVLRKILSLVLVTASVKLLFVF